MWWGEGILPEELPSCDVLELDCEGSEIDILRRMVITPRVIIVEIHPWLFKEPAEWVVENLITQGYEIVFRSGHNGIKINHEELMELLCRSKDPSQERYSPKYKFLNNGARYPVVIAGVK